MKITISIAFSLFFSLVCSANNPTSTAIFSYVDSHHEIAIQEMKRSGIPASILLAQAILTSQNGFEDLAEDNNNHFAIKCGLDWKGQVTFKSKNQAITEECFRSYPSAESCYSDYTNLLMEDRGCRFLFQYSYYDYQAWAEGMMTCLKYEDKDYAERIVKLIEKYKLDKYDSPNTFSKVVQKPIIGYEFEIN